MAWCGGRRCEHLYKRLCAVSHVYNRAQLSLLAGDCGSGAACHRGYGHAAQQQDHSLCPRARGASRVLEEAFCRHRIPHRVVGAVRFYERKEVKDVLAYLRLLYNKHDTASMERVLNVPPRGIGPQTRQKIQAHAQVHNCSVTDALLHLIAFNKAHAGESNQKQAAAAASTALNSEPYLPVARFSQRKIKMLSELCATLQHLQHQVEESTPSELMQEVISKMGLEAYIQSQENGQDRWSNILELQAAASRFPHAGREELGALLEMTVLVADQNDGTRDKGQAMLVTTHASKGLEFKAVFCVGMEEGTFPHHRALLDTSQLHEERRLAFVALTRARDLLYLTSRRIVRCTASWRAPTDDMPTKCSRFLLDIPSELQVHVCATGALSPFPHAQLARLLVVLTRAAAESRATAHLRSHAGDIVTWDGLRALALGSRPFFGSDTTTLDRQSNLTKCMTTVGARARPFELRAPYAPCGDQPRAILGLVEARLPQVSIL